MIRLSSCLLGLLLLAPAHYLLAQAQTNVPPAQENTPKDQTHHDAHVDYEIDSDAELKTNTDGSSLGPWLSKQADALRDLLACYLDETSLVKEMELETKKDKTPTRLIEVRIKLLKTLASHNADSHCK